jgi:hypothetical protein
VGMLYTYCLGVLQVVLTIVDVQQSWYYFDIFTKVSCGYHSNTKKKHISFFFFFSKLRSVLIWEYTCTYNYPNSMTDKEKGYDSCFLAGDIAHV